MNVKVGCKIVGNVDDNVNDEGVDELLIIGVTDDVHEVVSRCDCRRCLCTSMLRLM